MAAIIVYAAYVGGVRLIVTLSAPGASAAILLLGICCAVCETGDLYTKPQPRSGVIMRRVTCGILVLALGFGLAAIASGSGYALRNMLMMIIIFWTTAAIWHVAQ